MVIRRVSQIDGIGLQTCNLVRRLSNWLSSWHSFGKIGVGDWLFFWRSWKVFRLNWLGDGGSTVGDAWDLLAGLSNQTLGFLCILPNIRASGLGSASGMMSSKIFDLGSLLVDDVAGVLEMCINDLLVLDVDEGT